MSKITTQKLSRIRGEITIPGDKSISHRAIMISSLAKGKSRISNLLTGLDCQATIEAFQKMDVNIKISKDNTAVVEGRGLRGLKAPSSALYMGNSGTTMRLLLGILAGQDFQAILEGDDSLSKRPMKRVTQPLRLMGAEIEGRDDANFAPIIMKGKSQLKAISYDSPIASAQVKSAIIFAGLYADGITKITEPYKSRDHTERMLKLFGVGLKQDERSVSVKGMGRKELRPRAVKIPGDISSAAFFIVLGILADDAQIKIRSCGINPTRTGILSVLKRMGADIKIINEKKDYEPVADIIVKSSSLKATKILPEGIPLLIDEIPVIALCATQAKGKTVIEGIEELRVKETDRVNSIVVSLKAMGADIEANKSSIIIKGSAPLKGARIESFGDHRTAMMGAIAGCLATGATIVNDTNCIDTSFPDFLKTLKSLHK